MLFRSYPNAKSRPVTSPLEDDEATDTVDGQLLSHLVGEISEVSLDETTLGSIYDMQASSRISKKTSDKKNSRSRKVTKSNKDPKVSR